MTAALTVRRARAYLAIGLVAIVAAGWGSDEQSCQRSAYWAGYFNQQSRFEVHQAQHAMQFAHISLQEHEPGRYQLDLELAAADRAEAAALRTRPLECLAPLPEVPQHGIQ